MRIALVSNSIWNIYNFRLPVIRELQAAGYQVLVIAPVDEFVSALSEEKNLEIIPVNHLDRDSTALWRNVALWFELLRIYRKANPDLIFHYTIKPNIFGNLAAAVLKIPSVCVVTGLGYTFLHKGWLQSLTAWLYRFSFQYAKKVIFENPSDAVLMTEKNLVAGARTVVVPGCGVDLQHFSPNGILPQVDKTVFTFIGRLLADKGIREFVTAARAVKEKVPNVEFWVLGGLDDSNPAHVHRTELVEWVKNGIVQYKGTSSDVRAHIAKSDWIVLPSYREGLSRVLLEGMAMGKPLVTSDTPGCRETVEVGKNGFLSPVKDASALTKVLLHCCSLDKSTVRAMGNYGREKAIREFGSSLVGQKFLQVVQELTVQPNDAGKQAKK